MSNESYAQRRADSSEHQSGLLSSPASSSHRSRLINAHQEQQREHLLNFHHQSGPSQPAKLFSAKSSRLKKRYHRVQNSSVDGCLYLIGGQLTPTINKSASSSSLVRTSSQASQIRRQYRSSRTSNSTNKSEALQSYCQNSASRRRAQQRVEVLSSGAALESRSQQRPVRLASKWRPTGTRLRQRQLSVSRETINIANCRNDDEEFDDDDDAEDFYAAEVASSVSSSSSHKSPIMATGTGRRLVTSSSSMAPSGARSSRVPSTSTSPSSLSLSSGFSLSNTNLNYYNPNTTTTASASSMQQLHRGQYSSSQAHLQSLTSNYGSNSYLNLHSNNNNVASSPQTTLSSAKNVTNSNNSLRKTPSTQTATTTTPTSGSNAPQPAGRHHFSSQQLLFTSTNAAQTGGLSNGSCLNTISASVQNNTTKPMTSMLHNECSTAPSSPAFVGPQLPPPPMSARHSSAGQFHHNHFGSVPFVGGAQSYQANYMRPPVAHQHQFVNQHQQHHHGQLPPPYSSVVGHVSGNEHHQQQSSSAVDQHQQQQLANANSSSQHLSSANLTAATPQTSQPQAQQPQTQVRSIFNYSAGHQQQHQQAPAVPFNSASSESAQAATLAHREQASTVGAGAHQTNIAPATGGHLQQQLPPTGASQAGSPTSGNYQMLNGRAQLVAAGGSASQFTKSKSCLACADISIKWYIVVIALLGLICALIGTIVGAVHSVGRDFISLSLLLLGVGLVLIAISWIALRITINTYKSSPARPLATGNSNQLDSQTRFATPIARTTNGNSANHLQHQQHLHLNRPHGHRNHHQLLINQHQQAVINERFYMMAAAAAAAAAASASPANSTAQRLSGTVNLAQTGRCGLLSRAGYTSQGTRLLNSIKQRFPSCLGRLISNAPTSEPQQSTSRTQASAGGDRSVGDQSTGNQCQVQNPAANALAALLHQYQMLPIHQQASLLFAQNGLAPPLPPPPIHLFAAPGGAGVLMPNLTDPIFRPPPPSYNAAMQDQRIRMIMQERVSLQLLQHNSTGTTMRMPNRLPPPPLPPVSGSGSDQISSVGIENPQSAYLGGAQTVTTTQIHGSINSVNCATQDGSKARKNCGIESDNGVAPLTTQSTQDDTESTAPPPTPTGEIVNTATIVNIDRMAGAARGGPRPSEISIPGYL